MEKCTKSELCFLCNKKFQKPKILNCLHNYCGACLKKKMSNRLPEEKIRCPCCREITQGGVQKMKTNYFLLRVVKDTALFKAWMRNKAFCNYCCGRVALDHCFDCGKFLCYGCRMIHDNLLPPSSEHKIVSLDECREGKVPMDLPVSGGVVRCQNHGEKCQYFCETCQELVCRDYTDQPSQLHTYTNLKTAAIEGKKSTKALMSQLEKKLPKFEESLSLFKQLDPIFKKHSKQTIAEVQAFAAKIREEVTAKEKRLVQEIRRESHQQTELFNLTHKSLSESITRARFSLEAGAIFTRKSTESEFLWLHSLVENNLQSLVDKELPNVPKTVEFLEDKYCVSLGELKEVDIEQLVQKHQERKSPSRSGYSLKCTSQRKPKEEDASLKETANIEDIFAKFQPKPGDWKCDTCWLNNKEDAMSCIACMTPKPGAPPSSFSSKVPTSQETGSGNLVDLSSGGGFTFGTSSFGSSKTPGFQFGGPLPFGSTTSIPSAPQFALSSGAVKFGSTQSESAPATTTEQTPTTSHPTSRFLFGAAFQKFDLGGSGDKALQPVFGSHSPSAGFTLASSVISAKTEAAGSTANTVSSQAQQVTPVKPSTGFVFGAGTPTSLTQPSMEKPKGYSFVDMAKSQGSTFSFRLDVRKTTEASPEKTPKPKSPGFLKSPGLNKSADNEYYKDDDGDHIHFEPVVEMPECITVKTGEEDEISKFSHRAKLFRFDKDSSQWKERGIGDIKLLYNPSNGKYRIVMRREQVLKVCANHYITPELKLEPNAGSTKSWVWMAMDASEDEVQVEQLAVRFKMDEAAQQFKEAIDAAQEDMKTGAKEMPKEAKQDDGEKIKERLEDKGQSDLTAGVSKEDRDKSAVDFDLGEGAAEGKNDQDGFANYIGDQDYDEDDKDDVDDDGDDDNYIEQNTVEDPNVVVTKIGQDDEDFNQDRDALEGQDNTVPKGTAEAEYSDQDEDDGLKDVDKDVVEEEQDTVENPNLVSTEAGQNDEDISQDRDTLEGQDSTVPKGTAEAECSDKDDETYENVEGEQVDTRGGQADKESKIGGDGPEAEAEVGGQDDDQGYDVNEEEKVVHKKEPTKAAEDEKPFVAKSCDPNISKAFSELLRSANTSHSQKQKEATESASQKEQEEGAGSSKDDCVSGEGDDIHFEPVAYLPLQVEKITGEEDENQLFCSRAKLYRYDKESLQWKDRGIGDIKILHNPKTMRYRIVMRREQVLKLCANHYITKEMSLLPNAGSENSLVWNAMDASDGDIQPQQLAVRFKLAGTTQRFKAVFEECQVELRKAADQAGDDPSSTDSPKPDDVET